MKRLNVEFTLDGTEDYLFFLDKWEQSGWYWDTKFVSLSEDECIQRSRLWPPSTKMRVRAVDINPIKETMLATTITTAKQEGSTP